MKSVVATLAYTLFWLASRAPAIATNPLFFDDFAVPLRPGLFYLGSYRPLIWLEYRIWESVVPNHFWTVLPKLSAAVYFGASAALLAALLIRWNVRPSLAYTIPLVVLANPVLNDAGLWNSLHALPLAIAFLTAGVLVWEQPSPRRMVAGTALIFIGLNGYQIYVALVLVYLIAEPFVKKLTGTPWSIRDSVVKLALTAVAGALQVAGMLMIRPWITGADERGFASVASFGAFAVEKYHGLFNLAVNGVMPTIAYYSSALAAMSLWKFVPVAVAVATAIALRRKLPIAAALLFPIVIFFVPALPTLIMSQSPDAWRAAAPTAFALALSLLPLLLQLRIGPAIAVVVVLIMLPPAFFEAQERVKSTNRDEAIIRDIDAHWDTDEITIAYVGPKYGKVEDHRLIESHELTWGYQRFTPAIWSPFNNGWFAEHYAATYHGFRYAGCGERRNPVCTAALLACRQPRRDVKVIWPRVVHSEMPGVTAICVQ